MRFHLSLLLALFSMSASAQRLLLVSGNAQLVPSNFLASQPLVVRAVNASGQSVANVPVQWDGPALGSRDQVTNEEGIAKASIGGLQLFQRESYVTYSITASAPGFGTVGFTETTFNTSTVSGTFVGHPQVELIYPTGVLSGPPGTVIPRAFGVRVNAQGGLQVGSPIPNIGVRIQAPQLSSDPTAACQGPGNVALTNAQGEAYCDLILGATPAMGSIRAIVGEDLITPQVSVTITQGAPCNYSVNANPPSFGATGGSGTVTVAAGQGCPWTSTSGSTWITITSAANGQANGTVSFAVAANPGVARTGSILLADKTISISQSAAGSNPGGGGTMSFTSSSPLPSPTVGSPYTYQFGLTGGTAPYFWSATGTFPPGLGLDPNTGGVTGVPSTVGTFSFNITVRDASNAMITAPFLATVAAAGTGTIQITTTSVANGTVGTAYNQTLNTTGACNANPFSGGIVNWTLVSGSLPTGLVLNPTGSFTTIAGTPTQAGIFNFTVRANDSCGRVATQTFTTTVADSSVPNPTAMVVTPANIEISVAYTASTSPFQQVTVQTGNLPTGYTVSTTTPWLSLSKTQGTTPDSFEVRAVDIGAFSPGTHNGSLTITSGASNSPLTVPVALRVAAAANVRVGQESFLFQHTLGAPLSQQILNVDSVVAGGRTPFIIEWEADGGGNWLEVNPRVGETPARISIIVNTATLAVGTYRGTIRVRPTANAGGTILIPVTAVVTPVSTLTVPQRQLTFNGPGSQSISLSSTGTPLNFTAQTNGVPWLSVDPTAGITPAFLNIGTNASGLAPGTYTGAILVTPSNGSDTIQIGVTFNVATGQPTITGVTNAASFAPGPVAPGELVTIFGNNLGPANLVSGTYDASGTLQKNVANVQVLFDGVPAPIVYASGGQVTAIVPFGAFGRTTTRVQVSNNALTSNNYELVVTEAAPGIFTLDSAGQGAILNQDGTVNASLNGAEPGTVISIYATGAGQMEGSLVDGRIVTGTPKPLLPVGVRIGGRVADVLYAGGAPSLVGGMLQVNARIPADTPRGAAVPIQIIIGTATSQANVFVATRP